MTVPDITFDNAHEIIASILVTARAKMQSDHFSLLPAHSFGANALRGMLWLDENEPTSRIDVHPSVERGYALFGPQWVIVLLRLLHLQVNDLSSLGDPALLVPLVSDSAYGYLAAQATAIVEGRAPTAPRSE